MLPLRKGSNVNQASTTSANSSTTKSRRPATWTIVVLPFGDIWLDGQRLGSAPLTRQVSPGMHTLAGGQGSPEKVQWVNAKAGKKQRIVISLRASEPEGYQRL